MALPTSDMEHSLSACTPGGGSGAMGAALTVPCKKIKLRCSLYGGKERVINYRLRCIS